MFKSRLTRTVIPIAFIVFSLLWLFYIDYSFYLLRKAFTYTSYYSRPMWDKGLKSEFSRWKVVPFLGSDNKEAACRIHNFTNRISKPKVFDAFLFNSVDTLFSAEKIARDSLLTLARSVAGAQNGDIFHMSDLDELPHREVLELMRMCDFGDRIHLGLPSYRYSFEFRVWPEYVFRSTVSVLGKSITDDQITSRFGTYLTDKLLGGAGWHCSFCIRNIDDIIAKMKGYTHNDRLHFDHHSTDKSVLQQRICKGEDPFGYPPEAFEFSSLASMIKIEPMKGSQHVPKYLRENPQTFRFLLPGGCLR